MDGVLDIADGFVIADDVGVFSGSTVPGGILVGGVALPMPIGAPLPMPNRLPSYLMPP